MKGPLDVIASACPEEILYVTCTFPAEENADANLEDYIAVVDVKCGSPTYGSVVDRIKMPQVGDELHHSGWNACVSGCCWGAGKDLQHRYLIAPGLKSGNINIIDVKAEGGAKLHKVISGEEIAKKWNVSTPHTVHCSPKGEVLISYMGNAELGARGGLLALDAKTFEVKGLWEKESVEWGYDFWYQPRHNVMVSSSWGVPASFRKGFDLNDVKSGKYGQALYFWDWEKQELIQELKLPDDGLMPLEIRFLHNPDTTEGFVGCALFGKVYRYYKTDTGNWAAEKVIEFPTKKIEGWALPEVSGVLTDILISLDDRYLYLANWVQGQVRQYDITDTRNPRLVGEVYISGSFCTDSGVKIVGDNESGDKPPQQPERLVVKGRKVFGGPQMMQLSVDGKRLYVTTSLFTPWDRQFYPDMVKSGSVMVKIDCDNEKGGLKIDEGFLVDFGEEPNKVKVMAHEMRIPGGDSTSDIYA